MPTKREVIGLIRDDIVATVRHSPTYSTNEQFREHFDKYASLPPEQIYEDIRTHNQVTADVAIMWFKAYFGMVVSDEENDRLLDLFIRLRKECCDVGQESTA